MKKFSIFIILLIIVIGLKAQGNFIIPTAGFNMGLDKNSLFNKESIKANVGVSLGVSYRYEFKKPFLIEAGLIYNNQHIFGSKNIYQETKSDKLMKYNQLSVPVCFGYKFAIGKTFSITPKIGFQLGFYLNGEYFYSDLNGEHPEKINTNNDIDIASILGVEFGWRLNERLNIFVSITETSGCVNAYNWVNYGETNNSCFVFSFGTNVGLKIKVGKL